MSDDISKADTIAFHFYTKLFYTVNHARATEETRVQTKLDKWFNLETPDSDLFTKEAREPYRSISQSPPPGPLPMEIQVLLSVPELTNNQGLVYISPDSTRVRIEPTPRFILLETWTLGMNFDHRVANTDISPPVIYKHGIILFRSLFSLLRVLPSWKFYKRLKRRVGRNGHLGIQLRVRPSGGGVEMDRSVLGFDERLSPTQRSPLSTSTHTFPPVPHLLGSFTLQTTYLSTPHFQLDELESLLSSRFISLDLEGFVPTLDKNKQRDSLSGSSSLPNSSGIRSMLSRSPPKAIGMGRTTSAGGEPIVADRFILPTRVPSMGAPTTGTTALIPPPRPSFVFPSANPSTTSVAAAQPIPASGLAVHRLRRESLNSSSSSSISTRDRDNPNAYPYPANPSNPPNPNPFSTGTTTAGAGASIGGTSSLSSSPIPGALPIRKPHINPVHPFKSNTISSGSGSSPSLSIRQGVSGHGAVPFGGGSPSSGVGGTLPHNLHSRQASASSARVPPSPVHVASFTPSSLGDRDRRPGTSGSGSRASLDRERERRGSSSGGAMGGDRDTEDHSHDASVPMPMPPRKRYSSSFGHRYVSSVGSGTGGGVVGAGSGAGSASASGSGISAGEGGKAMVEGGSPGSGNGSGVGVGPGREGGGARKEAITSLLGLGVTTDDDDISIFVQHIDERKPLSSHDKERERDRDALAMRAAAASGQGHDREPTAAAKGKQRAGAAAAGQEGEDQHEHEHEDEEGNGRLRFGLGLGHARYTTSSPPMSALVPGGDVTSASTSTSTSNKVDDEEAAAAAAALLSTSPTRGPMLTNRDEVDERLKRMNENFLKSLEGIGGSRSRGRGRETRKGSVATVAGMRGSKEKEKADDSSHSNSKEPSESAASSSSAASNNKDNNNNNNPPASRFSQRTLDVGFPSTSSSSSSRGGGAGAADVYPSYPYNNNNNNTPSLGLGLGRGRHTPQSSSAMLGNSDGVSMASQGSEEVIGRMELYEERRRSGYHGA